MKYCVGWFVLSFEFLILSSTLRRWYFFFWTLLVKISWSGGLKINYPLWRSRRSFKENVNITFRFSFNVSMLGVNIRRSGHIRREVTSIKKGHLSTNQIDPNQIDPNQITELIWKITWITWSSIRPIQMLRSRVRLVSITVRILWSRDYPEIKTKYGVSNQANNLIYNKLDCSSDVKSYTQCVKYLFEICSAQLISIYFRRIEDSQES